jgi:pilus assembly protein CpaF
MLQAMNTGHDGSMTTIHANSPRDALSRLETLVLMAGLDLPSRAVREQISSALDLVVHIRRYDDGVRRIESVAEVNGLEGNTLLLQELFAFRRKGRSSRGVEGHFTGTGVVPRFVGEWREYGVEVPMEIFRPTI